MSMVCFSVKSSKKNKCRASSEFDMSFKINKDENTITNAVKTDNKIAKFIPEKYFNRI